MIEPPSSLRSLPCCAALQVQPRHGGLPLLGVRGVRPHHGLVGVPRLRLYRLRPVSERGRAHGKEIEGRGGQASCRGVPVWSGLVPSMLARLRRGVACLLSSAGCPSHLPHSTNMVVWWCVQVPRAALAAALPRDAARLRDRGADAAGAPQADDGGERRGEKGRVWVSGGGCRLSPLCAHHPTVFIRDRDQVWDYVGDGYVHRLLYHKGDGQARKEGALDDAHTRTIERQCVNNTPTVHTPCSPPLARIHALHSFTRHTHRT